MSGTIIELQRHNKLRSRGPYATTPYNASRQARVDEQIARIQTLLEELEKICRSAADAATPGDIAKPCVMKCRDILALPLGHPGRAQDNGEPQPQVDRRILERMYCLLDSYK